MSTIQGTIVVRETAAPVAGVIVVAYAAIAGTGSRSRRERLGSMVTDRAGAFAMEYRAPSDGAVNWELTLAVYVATASAAGEGTADDADGSLASASRRNPAATESFHLLIGLAELVAAGVIAVPEERDAASILAAQARATEFQATLNTATKHQVSERLTDSLAMRRKVDEHLDSFMAALSGVAADTAGRYVRPDESAAEVSAQVTREGVARDVNTAAMEGAALLSPAQLDAIARQHGASLVGLPAKVIDDVIWRERYDGGIVSRAWSAAQWCGRQTPLNDCVARLDPAAAGGEAHPGTGEHRPAEPGGPGGENPGNPDDPDDPAGSTVVAANATAIKKLITRLTSTLTSPEEKLLIGLRPSAGDVQGNVDGFSLRSGPADVPAVYDFHRLQIAFEPVWQELFDRRAVSTGRQLYERFVELGADPNKYLFGAGGALQPLLGGGVGGLVAPMVLGLSPAPTLEPPAGVVEEFGITKGGWNALPAEHQQRLQALAAQLAGAPGTAPLPAAAADAVRAKAARLVAYAEEKQHEPREFDQFHELLAELGQTLKEPYRFNVYAAGRTGRSINFALLVSYRQKWTPVTYQVGELVQTVPLAPKEIRKYTKRSTRKLSRSEKEMQSSLQSLRTESSVTARVESEIIAKARSKTNFEAGAEGGFSVGVGHASGSAKFGTDAERESSETKKEFRESVFKAAAEYRSEHRVEVDTSNAAEFSEENSGEISNPNDELPVTYLFYELQRRYRIDEKLRKVTPVVLVAQEFPTPDEIDEDWIVAHDWILRRVILDDSFVPAMNYLATQVVGDEHALRESYDTLQQRRRLLDQLRGELESVRGLLAERYAALQAAMTGRAAGLAEGSGEGVLMDIHEGIFGGDDPNPESLRIIEDAARDAFERVERKEGDLRSRLDYEAAAVAGLSDRYTQRLSEHLNRRTQISRLRVHLKSNIVYYMQAIYAHEPSDQRYFRLRDVQVPRLQGTKTYDIVADPDAVPIPPTWTKPHKLRAHVAIDTQHLKYDALGEVADLDNLLGFKGNYMMFPMKKGNALTDFMTVPYYDPFTGLRDPDALANWTLHEFAEYVCCLREHSGDREFSSYLPGLIEVYKRLQERAAEDNELVVPTGSLYIEALPGAHPILEDFKLAHRAIDVKKAQSEVRLGELENLRMAARLLADEREDPRVDKKILIEGAAAVVVDPDNG